MMTELASYPVPRDAFLAAMRDVANTVTVVTTDGPAGRYGATATAFASVSADPPTVLVCLNAAARIAQHVTRNRVFCVNVLPQGAAHIARRFAGADDADVADRFDGIACSGHVPHLEEAGAFVCDLMQAVPSGSHLILIGRVAAASPLGAKPLIYRDGAFGTVVQDD